MRNILLFCFLFTAGLSYSQQIELPLVGSSIIYKIQGQPDLKKDNIYLSSKDWATSAFKNFKEVAQLDDKELGKINLNGTIPSKRFRDHIYKYRITIECADNRYRFTVSDIIKVNQRAYTSSDAEIIYLNYLTNYKSLLQKKEALLSEKNKRQIKLLNKEIFDHESLHSVYMDNVIDIDKCAKEIINSYRNFTGLKE